MRNLLTATDLPQGQITQVVAYCVSGCIGKDVQTASSALHLAQAMTGELLTRIRENSLSNRAPVFWNRATKISEAVTKKIEQINLLLGNGGQGKSEFEQMVALLKIDLAFIDLNFLYHDFSQQYKGRATDKIAVFLKHLQANDILIIENGFNRYISTLLAQKYNLFMLQQHVQTLPLGNDLWPYLLPRIQEIERQHVQSTESLSTESPDESVTPSAHEPEISPDDQEKEQQQQVTALQELEKQITTCVQALRQTQTAITQARTDYLQTIEPDESSQQTARQQLVAIDQHGVCQKITSAMGLQQMPRSTESTIGAIQRQCAQVAAVQRKLTQTGAQLVTQITAMYQKSATQKQTEIATLRQQVFAILAGIQQVFGDYPEQLLSDPIISGNRDFAPYARCLWAVLSCYEVLQTLASNQSLWREDLSLGEQVVLWREYLVFVQLESRTLLLTAQSMAQQLTYDITSRANLKQVQLTTIISYIASILDLTNTETEQGLIAQLHTDLLALLTAVDLVSANKLAQDATDCSVLMARVVSDFLQVYEQNLLTSNVNVVETNIQSAFEALQQFGLLATANSVTEEVGIDPDVFLAQQAFYRLYVTPAEYAFIKKLGQKYGTVCEQKKLNLFMKHFNAMLDALQKQRVDLAGCRQFVKLVEQRTGGLQAAFPKKLIAMFKLHPAYNFKQQKGTNPTILLAGAAKAQVSRPNFSPEQVFRFYYIWLEPLNEVMKAYEQNPKIRANYREIYYGMIAQVDFLLNSASETLPRQEQQQFARLIMQFCFDAAKFEIRCHKSYVSAVYCIQKAVRAAKLWGCNEVAFRARLHTELSAEEIELLDPSQPLDLSSLQSQDQFVSAPDTSTLQQLREEQQLTSTLEQFNAAITKLVAVPEQKAEVASAACENIERFLQELVHPNGTLRQLSVLDDIPLHQLWKMTFDKSTRTIIVLQSGGTASCDALCAAVRSITGYRVELSTEHTYCQQRFAALMNTLQSAWQTYQRLMLDLQNRQTEGWDILPAEQLVALAEDLTSAEAAFPFVAPSTIEELNAIRQQAQKPLQTLVANLQKLLSDLSSLHKKAASKPSEFGNDCAFDPTIFDATLGDITVLLQRKCAGEQVDRLIADIDTVLAHKDAHKIPEIMTQLVDITAQIPEGDKETRCLLTDYAQVLQAKYQGVFPLEACLQEALANLSLVDSQEEVQAVKIHFRAGDLQKATVATMNLIATLNSKIHNQELQRIGQTLQANYQFYSQNPQQRALNSAIAMCEELLDHLTTMIRNINPLGATSAEACAESSSASFFKPAVKPSNPPALPVLCGREERPPIVPAWQTVTVST